MLNLNVRLLRIIPNVLVSFFISIPVIAHTPYYVPSTFEASKSGLVTLDASFAEKFFVPEVAFNNGNFIIETPVGESVKPDFITELKTRVVVEHVLKTDGTYRFSTGKRIGSVFTVYEDKGERKTARGIEQKIPKDSKVWERYQSITMAETYISKGAPNNAVLAARGTGLEIIPNTHPNDLFADDEFKGAIMFDGKPLRNAAVEIYLAKNQFSSEKPEISVQADEHGILSIPFEKEGVYLLRVRHRAPKSMMNAEQEIADVDSFSHTYTLVLEIYN